MYNWKDTRNYRRFRDENGNVIANIIYIDGEEVSVSDEVYEAYASMDRRERYLSEDAPAGGGREDDLVAVLRHHTAGQTRHAVDADAAFAAAAVAAAGGGQGTAGAAQQSQQGIGIIAGEAKNISAAGHADT